VLRNFGWILPGRLAGMARPRPGSAPELAEAGVAAVLALTEDPPLAELAGAGLAVHHEPVADFGAPTPDALARCVAFVRERLASGRAVVVHCHAGYGRTGTVLAACLVDTGLAPSEAIATVRRLRPGSIETPEQEDAIRRYAGRVGGGGAR
jgi:atypical dual specificity phosphatase